MYIEDKYTVLMENKRSLILCSAIFILLLLMLLGGDDTETSAGEITMPIDLERHEKPRAESPRKILGAEKANIGDKLADPFSIAHLTREEMEQAKLAAEARMREDTLRNEQTEVQVPISTVQREEKNEVSADDKDRGVTLQGIVKGEHGSMAILKIGNKSMTVAAGEKVGGRTVNEISGNEVRLDDGVCIRIQNP